jgi:tRNA pseudouridine32 synthase/23S rRNA pseudouridine746 synthase
MNTALASPPAIELVFRHRDFIVVNKPTDLSFHCEDGEQGVAQMLQSQFGERLWPVHRLDKLTSGVLIFARSADAARHFQELFCQHQVAKFYLAIATQKPKKKQGEIRGDMVKGRKGSWKLLRSRENPAITRFYSYSLLPAERLYLLRPYSGRTHQLRVAMKSLGSPILGDARYAGEPADRGYLHAWGVVFNWQGETIEVMVLPNSGSRFETPEFMAQIEVLSPPWAQWL